MEKRVRQWNIPVLLEACVLFALAVWLFVYLISGRYLVYVTPRMLPYLVGTVVVLLMLAGVTLLRLFQPNRRGRVIHAFILTLPLIFLLLPHGTISVSPGNLSSVSVSAAQSSQPTTTPSPYSGAAASPAAPTADVEEEAIDGLDRANRTIAITTENYYDWMERLYNDCAVYEGYTVSMTGYVINGSDVFAKNEFALARLVMTCCVADLSPVGVICKFEDASQLKADDWYSVEGTLIAGSYEADGTTYTEPQLQVTSITPAEAVSGYVYPY
ncbi:MAG: TIGR03943 family protein [Clostridiaceae bacterium]